MRMHFILEKDGCELRDGVDIALGGEFRSRKNIMILTAGVEVGEKYLCLFFLQH